MSELAGFTARTLGVLITCKMMMIFGTQMNPNWDVQVSRQTPSPSLSTSFLLSLCPSQRRVANNHYMQFTK